MAGSTSQCRCYLQVYRTVVWGVVNWNLIKTHWYDMIRVVLSIKAGKVIPSAST